MEARNMTGNVSVAVGLVCLVVALIFATVGKMAWPRVTVALVLTAAAGLLNGTIGPAVHRMVTRLDAQAAHAIGRWTGATITGLLALVVLGVAGFWVWQKKIDFRTLGVVAAVPPTVTLIPGALGAAAVAVVGIVPLVGAAVVGWALGIG
jgi:hypothetical protein